MPQKTHADVPVAPKTATSTTEVIATTTESALHALVAQEAAKAGVNPYTMDKVINCESQWNPKAVGDHGTSYGLAQIHLPAHPDITKAQAEDPKYAIHFMATMFAEGNENAWTCAHLTASSTE